MKGFAAYQMHHAMNLHFAKGSTYDYFKYHGKTRVSEESFKKNPFRWQYATVESKSSDLLFDFYLLFKYNNFEYVKPNHGMFKALRRATNDFSMNRTLVLTNQIQIDCGYLKSRPIDTLVSNDGLYPVLYNLYKNDDISLETLILIDSLIVSVLKLENSQDVVSWPTVISDMERIRPFVLTLIEKDTFIDIFNTSMSDD